MLQHVYLAAAMYIYVSEDMLRKLCSSVLILFANSKKELYPLHSNWLQKWNTFPAWMQQPQCDEFEAVCCQNENVDI